MPVLASPDGADRCSSLDDRAVRVAGKNPHGIDQAITDSCGGFAVTDEFNIHLVPKTEGTEITLGGSCSTGACSANRNALAGKVSNFVDAATIKNDQVGRGTVEECHRVNVGVLVGVVGQATVACQVSVTGIGDAEVNLARVDATGILNRTG